MPITKRTFVDQIVVEPTRGAVLWRETTVIEEDGVEIHRTYNRSSREADDDSGVIPAEVAKYRAMAVTPALAAAAKKRREDGPQRMAPPQAPTNPAKPQ